MTQNIYDNEEFFAGYSRLRRSVEGLDGAPEWPALRALLPDPRGCNVLDLGCGFGWFCRWAHQQGAAHVLGIDVSEKMLARAKETTDAPFITYTKADMEHLELQPKSFDLVYSSLALHYVDNLTGLMAQAHRSLVPGGALVFSVEHPIFTAPSQPTWSLNAAGGRVWPVDGYLDEGPRSTDWLTKGVIKQHRTLATYLNMLIQIGFGISHVEEWGPTEEQMAAEPNWADERQRPPFLIVAATRRPRRDGAGPPAARGGHEQIFLGKCEPVHTRSKEGLR
jgi:ubiquinone/menaquinone biosynthesis C-methylase UbiE